MVNIISLCSDLVDVRYEFSFSGHVDLLVVGSHLALDGEEENLQIPLLCESEKKEGGGERQ